MKTTTSTFLTSALLAHGLLSSEAGGAVFLSNLGEASIGTSPTALGFWFGTRFVTDNSAASFSLESASLSLGVPTTASGGLFVRIFSDVGSQPGTSLELLSGPSNPATAGVFTYTSIGLTLQPVTSYWLVAGVDSGDGNYGWNVVGTENHSGSWDIPASATHIYSFNQGGAWQAASDGFPRQFSLSATAIPEPATTASLMGGAAAIIVALRRTRGRGAGPGNRHPGASRVVS